MADILNEYLVSLGFRIDNKTLANFKNTLATVEKAVQEHTAAWAKNYAAAAIAIGTALSTVTLATGALMDHLARADLEYKKLALHMYMGTDAAKRMKIATDALGESLEDIAWIPELRQRYFALLKQEREQAPPGDYSANMKYLRDVLFEFTKLRVTLMYGAQWIGNYLFKYLNGPIREFHGWLKEINTWLDKNMPGWTATVAGWLARIVDFAITAGKGLKILWDNMKAIWDGLPQWGKLSAILGTIGGLFLVSGPFGRAAMVLSGVLLLVQDYFYYMEGKKNSGIWDIILPKWREWRPRLEELFRGIKAELENFFEPGGAGDVVKRWAHSIFSGVQLTFDLMMNTLRGIGEVISLLLHGHPVLAGNRWDEVRAENARMIDQFNANNSPSAQLEKSVLEKNYRQWAKESGINPDSPRTPEHDTFILNEKRNQFKIQAPDHWAAWSKEAGLGGAAPMTPENIDKVADFKFSQLMGGAEWRRNPGAGSIVAGYDLTRYDPGNPNHPPAVRKAYEEAKKFDLSSAAAIDAYIRKHAPRSPVTGADVFSVAARKGVDPAMLLALMQVESSYGTAGKGARSHNPGNVGNGPGHLNELGDWMNGIGTMADWLLKHQAGGYAYGAGMGAPMLASSTNIGSIVVNVSGTNATAEQIASVVQRKIREEGDKSQARALRTIQPVFS